MKICFGSYIQREGIDPMKFAAAFGKGLADGIRVLIKEPVEVSHFVFRDDITEAVNTGEYGLVISEMKLKPTGDPTRDSVGIGSIQSWESKEEVKRVILVLDESMRPKTSEEEGKEGYLIAGRKLVELFKKGYFDAVYLSDVSADSILKLYQNGRSAEEAKAYYGITDEMLNPKGKKEPREEKNEPVSSYYNSNSVLTENLASEKGTKDVIEEEKVVEPVQGDIAEAPVMDTAMEVPDCDENEKPVSEVGGIDFTDKPEDEEIKAFVSELMSDEVIDKSNPSEKEETQAEETVDMKFISHLSDTVDSLFEEDEKEVFEKSDITSGGSGFVFDTDIDLMSEDVETPGFDWIGDNNDTGSRFMSKKEAEHLEEVTNNYLKDAERRQAEEEAVDTEEQVLIDKYGKPLGDLYFGRREHLDSFETKYMESIGRANEPSNNVVSIVAPRARKQFSEPIEGFVDKITGSTILIFETVGEIYDIDLSEYALTGTVDTGVTGRIVNGKYQSGAVVLDGFGVRWMSPTTLMVEVTNINLLTCKDTILKKPCSLIFSKIEGTN